MMRRTGRLRLLLLALALTLSLLLDAQADTTCFERIRWGHYGDPSAGAAGFAPLVGVTCSGRCHEEAKERGLAVGPSSQATHQQCFDYCQGLSECEVWTWKKEEEGGSCEYKRALTSLSPVWTEDESSTAFSGPRNCTTAWLPPLETFKLKDLKDETSVESIPCIEPGKTYGQASAGSCADASTVEVFGDQRILDLGLTQRWWNGSVTNAGEAVVSAEACQTRCGIRSECGGFTFTEVEAEGDDANGSNDVALPLCQLKAEASCAVQDALGEKEGTLAGVSGECLGSAEGVHPYFAQCDTPRCRTPLEGTFIDDVYKPTTQNCSYHFANAPEMLQCLSGSWFLISGGSNAILTYLNWVNSIKPKLLDTQKSGLRTFFVDMVDVVFDLEGNALWVSARTWQQMGQSDFDGEISQAKRAALVTEWNKFNASPEGKVRLTLVVGQYWQNTESAWVAMKEVNTLWKDSKRALYAQIMIWYAVCGIYDIYFCTRYSIKGLGSDRTISTYEQEMDHFLQQVSESCKNSLGCFFAPHVAASEPTNAMTRVMKEKISGFGNDKLAFVDALRLTALKPAEVIEDHHTPILHMWIVNIILNSICSYEGRGDVGCPTRVRFSEGCIGSGVEYTDCPQYYASCQENSDGCKKWECASERICSQTELVISNSTVLRNVSTSTSTSSCETSSYVSTTVQIAHTGGKGGRRNRLWEGESWQGWVLSLVSALLASILVLILSQREIKYKKEGENQDNDKQHKKKNYLGALGFARLIASVHIVVGHLYAKGALQNNTHMFRFGFTWVPWFFMLSGFVLTHARLTSRDQSKVDDPLVFLWKRTATVFPLYAMGVIVSAIITCSRNVELPEMWILILQSWLLQSFIPLATERALQVHCWFLSCLLLYWLLFKPMYKYFIIKGRLSTCVGLMVIATLIPYIASLILPALISGDLEWYRDHKTGDVDDPVDFWTVFVKFNPLCYLHVFIFGMLLSKLRQLLLFSLLKPAISDDKAKTSGRWLYTEKFVSLVGYAGLFLVYNLAELEPPAYKIFSRLSVLMPLQGLVLLGLSLDGDLLSRCFSRVPKVFGDCSYAQYVIQFICYDLWPVKVIGDPSFFIFLMSTSMICTEVQKQATKIWLARKRVAVLSPCLLTIALVVISVFWRSGNNGSLPAVVKQMGKDGQPQWADIRLNLVAPAGESGGAKRAVINPSLAVSNGNLFLAARSHSISTTTNKNAIWQEQEQAVTEIVTTWDSSIVIGKKPLGDTGISKGWDFGNWDIGFELGRLKLVSNASDPGGSHWGTPNKLCEPKAKYIPSNNTLIRKIVTGAEDPKLLPLSQNSEEEILLTFNSLPPPSLAKRDCDDSIHGGVQQMFASKGQLRRSLSSYVHGVRIDCGSISKDEKNWIAFEYGEQLLYVYSVYPHKILQVRVQDGACFETGHVTAYPPLLEAAIQSGAQIHGSGTATLVKGKTQSKEEEYYLALLHFLKKEGDVYTTMLYKFAAQPPFEILSVSKPLPLQGSTRAFASGLLHMSGQWDKVAVTYGVANEESRALFMSMEYMESLFSCQ